MGICISVASQEIHDENVIIFEPIIDLNGNQRLCSVTLNKVYGMEDGVFCGVYDGHGRNGHKVSKMVNNRLSSLILSQKNAIEEFEKIENGYDYIYTPNHFDKVEDDLDPIYFHIWRKAILSAFRVMEKEMKLKKNVDCSSSGTTAVVVIRQGEGPVIANLGDSRAVLGTFDDEKLKAIQLTADLKPELPCEAERIRRCKGCVYAIKEEPNVQRVWPPNNENSPGLAMSRAFGDFLLKDYGVIAIPDICFHPLTLSDQFVVLASDGVWNVLSNNEVASIVWMVDTEEEAAKAVVEAATAAWEKNHPFSKVDDIPVVCLFLQKNPQNFDHMENELD